MAAPSAPLPGHRAIAALALVAAVLVPASPAAGGPFVLVDAWNTYGTGPGQFCNPLGVATPGAQFVYVSDYCTKRIQKLTIGGAYVTHWNTTYGAGDMAIAPDGTLVIPDTDHHQILRYDADGGFLGAWGVHGFADDQLNWPGRVAVASNGDVYVTEGYSLRVKRFTSDGTFVLAWGSSGSGPGQFAFTGAVVVDHDDNVWVADGGNGRIQKFAPDGTYLLSAGSPGLGDGQLSTDAVSDLAVDLDNNLYVVEAASVGRVQQFDPQGAYRAGFGTEPGPGDLNLPNGVAVDDAGVVYVSDLLLNGVFKFADVTTTTVSSTWGRLKALYR